MITGQLTPAQYVKQLAIKAVTLPDDFDFFALKNAQLLQYQQDTEGGGRRQRTKFNSQIRHMAFMCRRRSRSRSYFHSTMR